MPTAKLLSEAGQTVTPHAEGPVYDALDTENNGELGDTVTQTTYSTLPMSELQAGTLPTSYLTGDLPVGDLTGGGLPTGSLLT